jgi:hypothetical protein
VDLRENQYIKFPIKLEQYLMEGTYRKVEEVNVTLPLTPLLPSLASLFCLLVVSPPPLPLCS